MNWLRSLIPSRGVHRKNKYILPPENDVSGGFVGRDSVAHMKTLGFEIDTKSPLGNGAFGRVYKATFAGAPVACKVINLSAIFNVQRFVLRELDILRSELSHKNIVTIYAAFEPPADLLADMNCIDKVYIFMELLSIDLLGYIRAKNGLQEEEAKFLFKQIAAGLEYLHSQDIAHRDVKPENVLLNADRTVAKLTDFGLSVRVGIDRQTGTRVRSGTITGTPYTMAPQVHYEDQSQPDEKHYDAQLADVYSLGVTLFVMFENRHPFTGAADVYLLVHQKMNRDYVYLKHSSPMAKGFINYLMTPKEEERPTVTQALEHPWINSTLQVVAGRPSPKAVKFAPLPGRPASVVRSQQHPVSRVRADSLGRSREANLPIPDFADLVLGPRLARSRSSSCSSPAHPPTPFVPTAPIGIKPRDGTQRAAADSWDTPPAAATRGAGFVHSFQDSDRLRRSSSSGSRHGPGGSRVRPFARRSRAEEMGFNPSITGPRTDRDARGEDSNDDFMF